jgi:quaternary ammonium compound-resistance protein SugE
VTGPAYAICSGIGPIGAFVVGDMVSGEALSLARVAGLLMIVGGLAVLKLATRA